MLLDLLMHHPHPLPPSQHDGGGIDWGTAPAWAAVVVAFVAVCVSGLGIWTALRSYKDNNWQTKVKAARLVYCDVEMSKSADNGGKFPGFRVTKFDHWYGEDKYTNETGSGPYGFSWGPANRDIAGYHVVVRNNSDEPVGSAFLSVIDPDGVRVLGNSMTLGTLHPHSVANCSVIVPRSWPESRTPEAGIALSFVDSSGQAWNRIETEPPVEEN